MSSTVSDRSMGDESLAAPSFVPEAPAVIPVSVSEPSSQKGHKVPLEQVPDNLKTSDFGTTEEEVKATRARLVNLVSMNLKHDLANLAKTNTLHTNWLVKQADHQKQQLILDNEKQKTHEHQRYALQYQQSRMQIQQRGEMAKILLRQHADAQSRRIEQEQLKADLMSTNGM